METFIDQILIEQEPRRGREGPRQKLENSLYVAAKGRAKLVVAKMRMFKPKMKLPTYAKAAFIFLGCLLAVIAAYRHTNMKLLRAENGAFQCFAHESPERQLHLIRTFWTTQNHNHYIPIAFTSEFGFPTWLECESGFGGRVKSPRLPWLRS
jgi:hypothetical protein